MFPAVAFLAAISIPPCWNIFDTALSHSAASAHPQYVSYDERIVVTQDDLPLVQTRAFVDYRDDGLARVRDERFNFEPILTRHAEPGPPELGPYGPERDTWLPQADVIPTIASVRSQGDMTCRVSDIESYKGHTTYHLTFAGASSNRPALKALWVDTDSQAIWKVIVSGYVRFSDDDDASPPPLTNFEVELAYVGPYLVVDHVVWSYRRQEYSQVSTYFGEYTLSGYSFPNALPARYFTENDAALVSP